MGKIKVLEWASLATLASLLMTLMFIVSVFCAVSPEACVNRSYGFSINPPSGWTVDESGAFGTGVVFSGPIEDGFRVNIAITVKATSGTLDQEVSTGKSEFPLVLTNYHLISEDSRNIGGLDGYELVFTCTQGIFDLKLKEVLFVESGKGYAIAFATPVAKYDNYLPTFEESLQTFKLIGPEFPWQTLLILCVVVVAGVAISIAVFFRRRKAKAEPLQVDEIKPSTDL